MLSAINLVNEFWEARGWMKGKEERVNTGESLRHSPLDLDVIKVNIDGSFHSKSNEKWQGWDKCNTKRQ